MEKLMSTQDSKNFIIGQRIENSDIPFHYKEIDLNNFKPQKPILLVLGGTGTNNNKLANGYARLATTLVGTFAEDIDIISVNYNRGIETETSLDNNAQMLAEKFFFPLLLNGNQRQDIETACKNLRQITVFSHCYGDKIINCVTNKLKDIMLNFGYSYDECKLILKQIFMVSLSTFTASSYISTLNILSPFDETFKYGKSIWRMLLHKMNEAQITPNDKKIFEQLFSENINTQKLMDFCKHNHRCYVYNLDNIIYIATTMLYSGYELEHSVVPLARGNDWNAHPLVSPAGDCVSKSIGCALCNSVANSLLNQKSQNFVPFDLTDLQTQLEEIAKTLNEQELERIPEF